MNKSFGYILSIFLCFSISLILVGCGNDKESNESNPESKNGEEESLTIRVAGSQPEEHPVSIALKTLKETIEAETDGRIQLDLYLGGQLGDYEVIYDEVSRGTIDMMVSSIPASQDKRLDATYIPYLASNYDEVREIYGSDGYLYNTMNDIHAGLNVKFLGFFGEGFGGILTTGKEANNPLVPGEDKNVLLRVPSMIALKEIVSDLGFNTVEIPFTELYTALQTGIADGANGMSPVTAYHVFADQMKYWYQYNVFFENLSFVMNLDTFNNMSAEDQKLFEDTIAGLSKESFDDAENLDNEILQNMKDEGINVIEFTDEEIANFAEYARENTWPKLEEHLTKELVDGLLKNYE